MNLPQVSVIMPLYNSELYVEQAIRSVISQTYNNWELIVVNDCSEDSSASIVETLAQEDPRIRLLHTKNPSGSPTLPRNIAIENANGRYIAFLDSDDVWLPNKLEEQLALFNDDSVRIVYSDYRKIYRNGTISDKIVKGPEIVTYKTLLLGNVIGNLTGIYDCLKCGKHYMYNVGHEDYVHWLHILKDGGIARNTMYSFVEDRIAVLSTWGENPIHNTVEFELYAGPVFRNLRNYGRVKIYTPQ